ncbi:MAG: biopolymer transporter ExbD [Cyanobacteria bacterium]|nr:biopolymer transporter ExbD [Cyanobacteriota bacterium]
MKIIEEADEPAQVNILPAIDVIFAILTFFIMASLLLTRAEGLAVNLPQASSATPQQNRKVVVAIAPDGTIAVNRQPVVLDRLRAAVQTHLVAGERVLVAIAADETVDYGQVVAVMDRLRTLDGIQLGMATQRPR